MIEILVAIVAGVVLCVALLVYANVNDGGLNFIAGVIGVIASTCVAVTSIIYAFTAWDWFAAEHQANIINREYGTSYTQAEVFYAKNVIETVRQLDRKRIEINRNVLKGN